MLTLLWLLGLILIIAVLAWQRVGLLNSCVVIGAYLLAMTVLGPVHWFLDLILWALFLGVAIPLNMTDWRRRSITTPLFHWFRKVLPPISDTEREALEAGTVWWDGEIFSGRPDWDTLHSYPQPVLTAEEQAFLDGPVEELCRMTNEWQITTELQDLPEPVWEFIKGNGFFGLIIPEEYGGKGFSAYAHSQIAMKLASRSGDLGSTVMVPNSLGPAELLMQYGTDEQKQHYLPRLAAGLEVPCFALTSPEAGSDAGGMPDKGIVCRGQWQGQEVLGLRVTWEKRYITLGPVATLLGLAFKVYDPDGLLGEQQELGITLALIPTDTDGVEIGRRHFPLNAAFMNGPNSGKDVFIPMDYLIGGQPMIGHGWKMLMNCLAVGRSISLPAGGTGAAKMASMTTGAYARIRRQFNLPIGEFEGVQEALARIGGNTYVMDAARSMTAGAVDLGEKPAVLSGVVKYHITERMRQCLNDAMDVHGGKGICMGPKNYLGRGYQSIPISITVEGANILTRSMMIFGQGAIRSHPYVLREMMATQEPDEDKAIARFDALLYEHIGHALGNAAGSLLLGLTGGALAKVPEHMRDGDSAGHSRPSPRHSRERGNPTAPHGSPAFAEDDGAGHSPLPPRHSRERGNPAAPHGSPAFAEDDRAAHSPLLPRHSRERGNPHTEIRHYYRQLSRLSAAFATLTDASMLMLGGELKRRERLSARLGDVLSFIYLASACLKHYRDQGEQAEDLPLLRWGVEDLLVRIEQAMHEILLNFPDRAMSIALRIVIFPLGRRLKPPSDRTGRHVAQLLMTPGPARDRLLEGCYVSQDPDDVTGLLNDTLDKVILADPIEQRLTKAQRSGELEHDSNADDLAIAAESGVLSPDEANMMREARIARRAVIEVDDFSQEEMRPVQAGEDQGT